MRRRFLGVSIQLQVKNVDEVKVHGPVFGDAGFVTPYLLPVPGHSLSKSTVNSRCLESQAEVFMIDVIPTPDIPLQSQSQAPALIPTPIHSISSGLHSRHLDCTWRPVPPLLPIPGHSTSLRYMISSPPNEQNPSLKQHTRLRYKTIKRVLKSNTLSTKALRPDLYTMRPGAQMVHSSPLSYSRVSVPSDHCLCPCQQCGAVRAHYCVSLREGN